MNVKQLCTQLRLLGYEGDERYEAAEEIERLVAELNEATDKLALMTRELEAARSGLAIAQAALDGAFL